MKKAKILGVISTLLYIASIITALVLGWGAEIVLLLILSVVLIPMTLLGIGTFLYMISSLFSGMWEVILGIGKNKNAAVNDGEL